MFMTGAGKDNVPLDGGAVIDSMHGRLHAVVCQTHQVVAYIDDEGVLNGRRLDPLAILVEYLQAAVHVLPEQREALQVGVRAEPDILTRSGFLGRHGRVEVEDTVTAGVRRQRVEMGFGQVEGEGEDSDESSC